MKAMNPKDKFLSWRSLKEAAWANRRQQDGRTHLDESHRCLGVWRFSAAVHA